MVRFGICTPEQFFKAWKPGDALTGVHISYRLLDAGAGDDRQRTILFEEISHRLRLASGIYRTTYRGRFRDLDLVALRWLQEFFSTAPELFVEDRAASHCLTSAEWAAALFDVFPHTRFQASDRIFHLLEASRPAGQDAFILEPDGSLLQYVNPPFVLPLNESEPWYYVWNHWLRARARRLAASARISTLPHNSVSGEWRFREISHIHPIAATLAARDSRFRICTRSVFDPSPEACHALRTMNILNLSYFSAERLREAAQVVFASLLDGGLWIVGRTLQEDFTNHASVLQKRGDRFHVLDRVGRGSEIEDLALETRADQSSVAPSNKEPA